MSQAEHLQRAIIQRLESLRSAGVEHLPKPSANALPDVETPTPSQPAPPSAAETQPAPTPRVTEAPAMPKPANRSAALEVLQQKVAACTLCNELATTRTQTVFGVGNPQARLCFFGEAPGADEDKQGEPFVGRAGQLLTKIIEACTLKREDVYILNVLKCRPPGNRNPLPDEVENCQSFFLRQLEIIQPEYLCCLGAVAAQNLLQTTQSIGKLRGRFHDFNGIKVLATYHPAYLLRNPSAKRQVWEDMKFLMNDMGLEIPAGYA